MKKITYLILFTLVFNSVAFAQKKTSLETANDYLSTKGEVIFTFKAKNQSQFLELNKILSVSHKQVDQKDLEIEAYANKEQFQKFLKYGLPFSVRTSDNEIPQEKTQRKSINGKIAGTWDTTWDAYPKYSEYVAKMQYWAATYPSLCTLQSIGTTANGRELYVLKISDNASADETEPEFFYTSSMHGDEITGYPTMLRLIDYLLTNYGSLSEITNLVNGTELFINPLANPDGSYKSVGNDVYNPGGATNTPTRANAAGVDLNRNYPDAIGGMHPDGFAYQTETTAFLNFEATRNFVLAANYHGGTEVVNFPLDTSNTPGTGAFSYHPHDDYFKFVSQEYAQLCQTADGNLNYMDAVYNTGQFPGTTNGAAWYSVFGGRQDCNNYFNHSKEVTVEISNLKTPLSSDLPFFWDRNRQALLNYVKQASYGLHGVVTDGDGKPIHAKVYVGGAIDNFGAWVETSPTKGDYHKVQIAGTYDVIFEAAGFATQTLSATITNNATTILNVTMVPSTSLPTVSNDVTICQGLTTTLTATGSGTIKWYDSINATTAVATGTSFTTPALSSTTSYFAESEVTPANVGPTTVSGASKTNTTVANQYLTFNCTAPTKLKSVLITASAVGEIYVELQNSSGVMLESKVVRLTTSGTQDIALDFFLPVATGLRLVSREINFGLTRANSGITYPMTSGTISITGNSGTGTFFHFFNWKFEPIKSNRKEVVVTLNPSPTITGTTPATGTDSAPITLGATASSGTISWYAAATGGSALGTGASFTTPILATTKTYYVETSNGICVSSPRTAVVATVTSLDVKGNTVSITNGDTTPSATDFTDFGNVPNGNKFARTFVLKNISSSNLIFAASNTVVLSGADAGQFSITTKPANSLTLNGNTYTMIEVSFNPTSTGTKTATLTINLSTGSPSPYSFTIQGTGTAAVSSDFVMTQVVPNSTFNYPYELIYGPDNYLWLTERVGKKINRVNPSTGAVDLLVDMSALVTASSTAQNGLMGMALHPNFLKGTNEDYVYVSYNYTDVVLKTKIVRYSYSISGNDGTLSNPVDLIVGLSGSTDHNSGKLKIGPDGKLYYTIGDQGANQFANMCKTIQAQTLPTQNDVNTANYFNSYQGKTLRMNLDGSIPTDNPVLNSVKSHVYTYGHRNPQGLTFGSNGKLYSNEHGPKSDDEINILQSGGNYGWPFIAGYKDDKNYTYCDWSSAPSCASLTFSDYTCGTGATSTLESNWTGTFNPPITTLFTIDNGFNFTGGWLTWPTVAPSSVDIYEGFNSVIPGWNNSLITTTLKKGKVYRTQLSSDGNSVVGEPEELFYTQNRYRDSAFDPDGKTIYIITDSGGTTSGPSGSSSLTVVNPGTILKFVYQPALVTCAPVPNAISLPTITGQCSVTLTAPTATSPCTGTIIGTTPTEFPITAPGTTTVTWTYSYENGATVTQNQNVTIDDTVAPICITKDITISVNTTITANDVDNGSTDNCGISTKSLNQYTFTYSDIGVNTVTLTLTDSKGNTSFATAQVTVQGSLDIKNPKNNLFVIYPIPFNNQINIDIPNSYTQNSINVQLYNMNGTIVYNKNHLVNNQGIQINDLSLYSDGSYFIYLLDENQKEIQKKHILKNTN